MIRGDRYGRMGRRRFAGLAAGVLLGLFAVLTGRLTRRTKHLQAIKEKVLPADLPEGVSFHEGIIAIRHGSRLTLLSAHCTHLGCRINSAEEGSLRCPCHGSEFAEDGTVVKGPAAKPLKVLQWQKVKDKIIVHGS